PLEQLATFQPIDDGAEGGLGDADLSRQGAEGALLADLDAVQDQQLDRRQPAMAAEPLGMNLGCALQPPQGHVQVVHHRMEFPPAKTAERCSFCHKACVSGPPAGLPGFYLLEM